MQMNRNTTYFPSASEDVTILADPTSFTPPANIYLMRVIADQACRIVWTKSDQLAEVLLSPGIPEYFVVHPGDPLTVRRETTDGTLQVAWMTN